MSGVAFAIAQLRHAYAQLAAGTVVDQASFARGLIGPAIAALERAADAEREVRSGDAG